MGEPLLKTDTLVFEAPPQPRVERRLASVKEPQPVDEASQAVFIPGLDGELIDQAALAVCMVSIRQNFAVAARDGLSAVMAREPIKVSNAKTGELQSYEFKTWPSYLLECRRYARDRQKALMGKARADERLAEARKATLLSGAGDDYRDYVLGEKAKNSGVYGYVQHAALAGLKLWLKAKVA